MTTDVTTPATASLHLETGPEPEQVVQVLAACPNCGNRAILFSHTIQTFCYHCGKPVTSLDQNGLYYVVIVPPSPPDAAAVPPSPDKSA